MNRRMIVSLLGLGLWFAAGGAHAEEAAATPAPGDPGLVGFWTGQIEVPGRGIGVSVAMAHPDAWTALIDVPDQGIRKVPMTGVEATGKTVTLHIPGVPGDPTFKGTLADDGAAIVGTYSQGGQSIPFRMERGEKPADYDADFYADYRRPGRAGEGFAGEWRGLIEAGVHRFRMKLTLESVDETPQATLVSVDQRATSFSADSVSLDGGTVEFSVARLGVSFEGSLNDDGSAIVGEWSQGGATLPVTFRRKGSD